MKGANAVSLWEEMTGLVGWLKAERENRKFGAREIRKNEVIAQWSRKLKLIGRKKKEPKKKGTKKTKNGKIEFSMMGSDISSMTRIFVLS